MQIRYVKWLAGRDGMNFYRRMEIVCQRIPLGTVVSYGQVALLCGKPHNARQVGYALSHGSLKGDISAHRIVNSRGELSGAGGSVKYN